MGSGASKPLGRPGIDRPLTKSELEAIPRLSVPMLHVFGPKKGQRVVLNFRALRPPETSTDAEIRVHKALERGWWMHGAGEMCAGSMNYKKGCDCV